MHFSSYTLAICRVHVDVDVDVDVVLGNSKLHRLNIQREYLLTHDQAFPKNKGALYDISGAVTVCMTGDPQYLSGLYFPCPPFVHSPSSCQTRTREKGTMRLIFHSKRLK
jgi:hypothetical protein